MTSRPRSSADETRRELAASLATRSRAAAAAFEAAWPAAARALGDDVVEWAKLVGALADASGALAVRYCEVTAALPPTSVLAWGDETLHVRHTTGWRGERLASALLASLPDAAHHVPTTHLRAWTTLAARLRPPADATGLFGRLSPALADWSVDERTAWLDVVLALAKVDEDAALHAHADLPPSVQRLQPDLRARLLTVLAAGADADAAALASVVPVVGAILAGVPASRRETALVLAETVARGFPAGLAGALRNLGRVLEETSAEHALAWAERGVALGRDNPDAGRAFFALASRTSLRVLRASPTAVAFADVQGVLRRVIHMLSGTPAVPRPSGRFALRAPLESDADAGGVALPEVIDRLDTYEDNARLYAVLGALLAGRREYGTYDDAELVGGLRRHARASLLEELFLVTDGFRVACRLRATYPGVAADLTWAAERVLASPLRPDAPLDPLFAAAIAAGSRIPLPPWLAGLAALVLPSLQPLADVTASAADARRVAVRLLDLFPEREDADPALAGMPELLTLMLEDDDGTPFGEGNATFSAPDEDDGDDGPPPELMQELELELGDEIDDLVSGAHSLSPEELRRLLESGAITKIAQAHGIDVERMGLYVTQLMGKRFAERETPDSSAAPVASTPAARARRLTDPDGAVFVYDEWDYQIRDYRPDWCRLREIVLPGDSGVFFDRALARHATLVPEIRRHFLRVRPDTYRPLRGLEDGDDFDLNAVVDAHVQRRTRHPDSSKVYTMRARQERDVATLFLLDMSASTDEAAPESSSAARIIDIAKDALVIMASALEEIGDTYAIYGFSGQGRDNVEVYPIKAFEERLTAAVQSRLGGIEPRGSTRMGTALRHVVTKMKRLAAPSRHLLLLSDGFPQDLDYGADRQSHLYGIRDTAVALRETQRAGVRPFCITVDLAGHDYLREMCDPHAYMVIEDVADLPRELPKIYQRLVHAA